MAADNHYIAIKKIGEGALGEVFKARNETNGQIVAVKTLHQHLQGDPFYRSVFNREVLTTAKLRHPNLIKFLDCNLDSSDCFMVSEFIDGWTIRSLKYYYGRIPPLVACAIMQQSLPGAID